MATKPIEGVTFASEAEFTSFMTELGYRLSAYKAGAAFKTWIVTASGEHLGTVKWLKKSGKATYDFMFGYDVMTYGKKATGIFR